MNFKLNDENTTYLGDGAYGHIDEYSQLWVLAYNGETVTEQVCLEEGALESLISLINRVKGKKRYIAEINDDEVN